LVYFLLYYFWKRVFEADVFIGVYRISQWRVKLVHTRGWFGYDMASADHERITGVWQSPQRGPGAEPLVRGLGKKPPKAGAFLGPGRPKEIADLLCFVP